MSDRRQFLVRAYKIFDLLVMLFCFVLATLITNPRLSGFGSIQEFLSVRIKMVNFVLFLGLVLFWYTTMKFFTLYQSKRLSNRWKEIFDVIKATLSGSVMIYLAGLFFHIEIITLPFVAVFWISAAALMIVSRLILRWFLGWVRRRGRNLRNILIVGTNPRSLEFARSLESKQELGYRIIGFVDTDWEGTTDFLENGYKIVSDFERFPSYLRENVIDEVIISLPLKSYYKTASEIAALSQAHGIVVRSLPNIFDLKTSRTKTESIEGLPLISSYIGAMEGWQVEVKRLLDILFSSLALIGLSPLLLITAITIKLTSKGPVFFIQERLGINKRRFRMVKFRTMIPGAEQKQDELEELNEACGPVFKIKKDPRITPLGKIVRKLSIDELPQLFNVFKGDMSLVGPRPLPIRDYNGFSEDWHRRRFSVRPGITCLWQVNGRCDVSFEEWMELDMKYIDNWSLWMDFKILALTIPAVIKGSGAV